MSAALLQVPKKGFAGLRENWRQDMLSGFLVFLIALPLCLGIAMASGYPPIAGIFTAIIGGIVCPFISNSELTIKGPAAGLIVIAAAAVTELGQGDAMLGYQLVLGIGVAAGIIQILFALFRTGFLSEFFPTSAVHGMLAAIGIIIAAKQMHTVLGVIPASKETLELILEIPRSLRAMNPEVALIGLASLLILFTLPLFKNKYIRMIPGPMVVLFISIPLGFFFDLAHRHSYLFLDQHEYTLGPRFLVSLPQNMFDAITFPDFSALVTGTGIKYVIMFALVGSLESLLSARAIDMIDPYRRKTNLDRDMLAVGIANTMSAMVGGLPMISEIVRSAANTFNGARTRLANAFHGLFLLGFVALFPGLIHSIPLAALGAMLVYTGYRLAAPGEWLRVYKIGREQLVVFTVTVLAVLATDLLVGIAIGVGTQILMHVLNGVPLRSLFKTRLSFRAVENTTVIVVRESAVFSSWISLKNSIGEAKSTRVILDLSRADLVDHSVMEKLEEVQKEFEESNRTLIIRGLERHEGFSSHPHATQRIKAPTSDMEMLKNILSVIGCPVGANGAVADHRPERGDLPKKGIRALKVPGCHFMFDEDGAFVGVSNEPMDESCFEPATGSATE